MIETYLFYCNLLFEGSRIFALTKTQKNMPEQQLLFYCENKPSKTIPQSLWFEVSYTHYLSYVGAGLVTSIECLQIIKMS